jgi:DNA-directed RNA polymerase subunit RPC12/RpoP
VGDEFTYNVKKQTILILFFSITSLMLISFLPWISVTDTEGGTLTQHFNIEMMENSNDPKIIELSDNLGFINLMIWVVIILGLLSFLGTILNISQKYNSIGRGILLIGCSVLVFSIITLVYCVLFVNGIISAKWVALSYVFKPFSYAYIPLMFVLMSVISSVSYTIVVALTTIKNIKKAKEQDKKVKKTSKKKTPKKSEVKEKTVVNKRPVKEDREIDTKKLSQELDKNKKRDAVEDWLSSEVEEVEKPVVWETEEVVEEEPKEPKEKIATESEETYKEPEQLKETITTEEAKIEPFQSKEIKKEVEEPTKADVDHSFEKALSSAIEKKQGEIIKQESDVQIKTESKSEEEKLQEQIEGIKDRILKKSETEITYEKQIEKPVPAERKEIFHDKKEQMEETKKFNVRCPQCKQIFTTEISKQTPKIKCPHCGKEGMAK